jgi:hypothetical protein
MAVPAHWMYQMHDRPLGKYVTAVRLRGRGERGSRSRAAIKRLGLIR